MLRNSTFVIKIDFGFRKDALGILKIIRTRVKMKKARRNLPAFVGVVIISSKS